MKDRKLDEVKEFLNDAYRSNEIIKELMQELEYLKYTKDSLASSLKETSKGGAGGNAPYVKLIEKIIERENIIIKKQDEYLKIRISLRDMINNVENVTYNLVLKKRYLQFYTFENIAAELNYTTRSIYRIHQKALRAFLDANQNKMI